MRRFTWVIALVVSLSLVLAGCGKKDAGAVVKDLDGVINKLDSYQGVGRMVLNTGQEPQEYQVEVWYQNPHYYRISLKNDKKDITQIVLRNDDGVFVLTPHLNKSFRFQSDWPENQGQVYLYQSLVQSIIMDKDRQFITDPNAYVFDVMANYQNGSLARQKIWLDKKNYSPKHVEVSDANANVMVIVDFSQFEFGKKFEKDSFDMQRNMTSWNLKSLPTAAAANGTKAANTANNASAGNGIVSSGTVGSSAAVAGTSDGSGKAAGSTTGAAGQGTTGAVSQGASSTASGTGTQAKAPGTNTNGAVSSTSPAGAAASTSTSAPAGAAQAQFGVIEPFYTPSGVKRQDMNEIKLGEEKAMMLRYSGKFNYTLVESRPQAQTVSALPGDIVDLGYTLAVITGGEKKMLTWTYDGVEFRLSTADLPMTEMIKVAQAVQGETGK
ncbi:outer membrane lipoprotein carrier protein LolA [Paenibacillus sp. WQ 127069]|uniref:Outer membrane lipoprotein carrier protein LolA n=1 Tax=Paenibacillus baimaensis TaxID=2982185 RepID=A0ABT2UVF2_9BACL|nr:outer membrane lipoprotein carrier protein LolA [Paenibacillus sp. WQ 127069]MCU6797649.1 outer membrane lipoprotein carrier protein LolA [Paenibacillus sp. WQ 127069]